MKLQVTLFVTVLVAALLGLQYRLWFGENSVSELRVLKQKIAMQEQENALLREKNAALMRKVEDLRTGHEELEARARKDLGMIKPGETFFLYLPEDKNQNDEH